MVFGSQLSSRAPEIRAGGDPVSGKLFLVVCMDKNVGGGSFVTIASWYIIAYILIGSSQLIHAHTIGKLCGHRSNCPMPAGSVGVGSAVAGDERLRVRRQSVV